MQHRGMKKDTEELVRLLSLKKFGLLRDYLASTTEKIQSKSVFLAFLGQLGVNGYF